MVTIHTASGELLGFVPDKAIGSGILCFMITGHTGLIPKPADPDKKYQFASV